MIIVLLQVKLAPSVGTR